MRWLVRLYPRDWRCRYGAEMEAQLRQWRPGPREAFDLLAGAVDAHLHPQWSGASRRRGRRWLAVALGVLVAALASHAVAVALGAADAIAAHPAPASRPPAIPAGQGLAAVLLGALWLLGTFGLRRLGSRLVAGFAALLALRFVADWALLPAAAALARTDHRPLAIGLAAGAADLALWGAVAALVLHRTRLRWPVAFAIGCLLELALGGGGLSLSAALEQPFFAAGRWRVERWDWSFLPGYLEPLRIATWAALMAWLASRRRPRPWGDPREGAPVSARPLPDPPEPVAAHARRAS
jgi:hypothetical protein